MYIKGWNNNLGHSDWGSCESQLSRKVASNYADGVYMVDDDLPSPRLLSQALMRGKLFFVALVLFCSSGIFKKKHLIRSKFNFVLIKDHLSKCNSTCNTKPPSGTLCGSDCRFCLGII